MPNIARKHAVMIGDGLATDIKGARRAGIDAVWIAGGIHAVEVGLTPNGHFDLLIAQKVAAAAGEELIAVEVRAAMDEIGQIVGAVYTDDILDQIFSRFCIGK